MRKAEISRNTKETRVSVSLDLSGGELSIDLSLIHISEPTRP